MKRVFLSCFISLFIFSSSLFAEVKLPTIFAESMVIQRDRDVKIWGWANKNEKVEIGFNSQILKTKADKNGNWNVTLKPMTYGGPYTLIIKGKDNKLELKNILVGDVWLCSGQSNMEFQVFNSVNYTVEIEDANYPQIRSFNVVREMSFQPQNDFKGKWEICSPTTVGSFSAVAYFYARKLYKETGIPIGIVNSSWGGTDIEAWTSPDSFKSLPEKFKTRYNYNDEIKDPEEFIEKSAENKMLFEAALKNDLGLKEAWYKPSTDISSWSTIPVPQIWEISELASIDGVVWVQFDFTLPTSAEGKSAEIELGKIDDDDDTWINGIKIGSTAGYTIPRKYNIETGVLKGGQNRITIKIIDYTGGGGLYSQPDEVFLVVDGKKYSLSGNWKYKITETNKKYNFVNPSPNVFPSLLYNAMIQPITQFAIKGVIWYQGENNSGSAYDYRTLFPNMITDWRAKWGYEFPFYWVQLANYMASDNEPKESTWAELREAQTLTLSLPQTGQAVITDIGDANDIHPKNKQDVGLRLAMNALNKDYGKKDVAYSGPLFNSSEIQGDKVVISFSNVGLGLVVKDKYGYVSGFTIAGADQKFVWAKAYLEGNNVVVSSDKVQKPVAVRYNWANNPDGNLFNKDGLPASPFRTDTWKGITEK